jgi:hypothetical protein
MILIHTTNTKIDKIKKIKQLDTTIKPIGLWYAENKLWLDFATKVLGKTYKYFYIIKLNYTTLDNPSRRKVLRLSTVKDFDRFTFKYGYVHRQGPLFDSIFIHWNKVSKKYGGIEVAKEIKDRRCIDSVAVINYYKKHGFKIETGSCTWFYPFDIHSGCVWNPKSVKSFKQI